MIETADRDLDDRTVAFLLSEVAGDGGQWNMFVELVAKHGVVPKTVMPETHSSSETARMNEILQSVLRQGALELRGCPTAEQQERKQHIVEAVHRVLCIHLGTPPERFGWQWTDKDRVFHRDGEMTRRSSRRSTSGSDWRTTSVWSMIAGQPARRGGRSPWSTSGTWSADPPWSTSTSTLPS